MSKEFSRNMRITLACGCVIRLYQRPNNNAKFPCPGAGHGYQQPWKTSVTADGYHYDNPLMEKSS